MIGCSSSKVFIKVYCLIFLAGFAVPGLDAGTVYAPNVAERYLLASANRDRVARGLAELHLDPMLAQAALYHAREMASHSGISHQFPGEPDLSARGANAGVRFSLITENVAEAPESTMIHELWMNSPGHRANLLDPDVSSIGVSVVVHDHQFYAVEDFADSIESLTIEEQESSVSNLLKQEGLQVINEKVKDDVTVADARHTCSMSTGYAGHRQPWFILRYTASRLDRLPEQLVSRIGTGKYHQAVIGACADTNSGDFSGYNIAVLLYP